MAPSACVILVLVLVFNISGSALGASIEPDIRAFPLALQFNEEKAWEQLAAPGAVMAGDVAVSDQRMAYAQTPAKLAETATTLVLKARQSGTVRIIVGVNTAYIPSGHLNAAAAALQRQGIGQAQQVLADQLTGVASTELRRFKHVPFMALEVSAEALELLATLPGVLSIEESIADEPDLASSNPVIGSPQAWSAGYDGAGQVVAVLDTGVDKTHPYFATDSKVVSEACFSSNKGTDPESGSSVSVCPDGVASSVLPDSGVNCPLNVSGCNHGTHVAGIAVGNDHIGPNFGVARGAQLIAVQVFSRFNHSESCGGSPPCALSYPEDQIAGMERVYDLRTTYNIAAVNMSLGGGNYTNESDCDQANLSRKAAIDNLRSAGIATVISSGNNGYRNMTGAPGCISTAIEVAATTDVDAVASFSNIASFLELLAPGDQITSSAPGGGTISMNGTSMAAPHVTGAWAIMKQHFPSAMVDGILVKLQGSGKSVNDLRPAGTATDIRRINIDLAVGIYEGFMVFNDGGAALNITSITADSAAPWIMVSPAPPFSIPAGGSQLVTVTIDYQLAPAGFTTQRLLIASNDPDENPLPGGVDIEVTTPDEPPPGYLFRDGFEDP